jgi:Pro-kumamolisin, activation domain
MLADVITVMVQPLFPDEFLLANGLKALPVSPAGHIISFSVPVSQANKMFNADFSMFTHQATGEQTICTLSYSVPSVLTEIIQFIHPTMACISWIPSLSFELELNCSFHQLPDANSQPTVDVFPPSTGEESDC